MGRKIYVDLSDTFDAQREKINILSTNVGDLDNLVVPSNQDSDLVEAINWVYNNAVGTEVRTVSLKLINSAGTVVKEVFGFDSAGS
jgi:hypothetical protein|tara:strand:+ start:4742 stop:4999 length:258 start_codon:yes stop_codon:yes gene_type:complete